MWSDFCHGQVLRGLTTRAGATGVTIISMNAINTEPAGIRAKGLTKSYGPVQAVRGIDLAIAPGETVALLGLMERGSRRRSTWCWA